MTTPHQYYNDESQHGNYQYISLKDIIDNMLLGAMDDDSYLRNIKRFRLFHYALQAIKEVNKSAANDVLAFEITVPDNLVVIVPQDYVNYVRVSVVVFNTSNGGFYLQPLDINESISTAVGYLQDHKGEILFDEKGGILTADSLNGYAKPYKKYSIPSGCSGSSVDTAKLSKYGHFKVDERAGKFLFSSDLMDKEVVIEYVSDGLQAGLREEEITVHKYLQKSIEDFIYHACIERNRNVPANEKLRASNIYKSSLHKAKMARANFDLLQIAKHL
ncbi:hypothetical protein [Flavobacterium sp. HSC-61S13]|uniref:hypothetical protein n=1 Tax=Flavobacterium sp. HSC-61S13 TaxID=2910963 RepID=UPI00209DAE0C|nr:hypothetical protein [Flavobacterium sp. HSC-61S13]MCP1996652.1 hypothetical protein [Flavobacterium sp. HSC-61S13]